MRLGVHQPILARCLVYILKYNEFDAIVEVNTYLDVVEQAIDCTRPAWLI